MVESFIVPAHWHIIDKVALSIATAEARITANFYNDNMKK